MQSIADDCHADMLDQQVQRLRDRDQAEKKRRWVADDTMGKKKSYPKIVA